MKIFYLLGAGCTSAYTLNAQNQKSLQTEASSAKLESMRSEIGRLNESSVALENNPETDISSELHAMKYPSMDDMLNQSEQQNMTLQDARSIVPDVAHKVFNAPESLIQTSTTLEKQGPKASAFDRGVSFINVELEKQKEAMDLTLFECGFFKVETETTLNSLLDDLMFASAKIADSNGRISEAGSDMADIGNHITFVTHDLDIQKDVCATAEFELRQHRDALKADLNVAESIGSIAEKECRNHGKKGFVQVCDVDGETVMSLDHPEMQKNLAKLKHAKIRQVGQAVLWDAVAESEFEDQLAIMNIGPPSAIQRLLEQGDQGALNTDFPQSMNTGEGALYVDDNKQAREEMFRMLNNNIQTGVEDFRDSTMRTYDLRQQYGQGFASPLLAENPLSFFQQQPGNSQQTQTGSGPKPHKCVVSGKPDCGKMLDKLSTLAGEIQKELFDANESLTSHINHCNQVITALDTEIENGNTMMGQAQSALMDATSKMLRQTQTYNNKQHEKHKLCKALKKKFGECHRKLKERENSICALTKIRQQIFKQMKKENPTIQDCEVGNWSAQKCSMSCDDAQMGGTQTVVREVITPPSKYGSKCPPLEMKRTCNKQPCPIDCAVDLWTSWSKCSKSCGGGAQTRHRQVNLKAEFGGVPCPETSESRVCNSHSCDVDCTLHDWTPWSPCSKACRFEEGLPGFQYRRRHIRNPTKGDGKCAGQNTRLRFDARHCNDYTCPLVLQCEARMDLVILMDGSASLRHFPPEKDLNFELQKEFVSRLIKNSNFEYDAEQDRHRKMRFALVQFSGWPQCGKVAKGRWCMNESYIKVASELSGDRKALETALAGMKWMNGSTYTHEAITTAMSLMKHSTVNRMATTLIVTDGITTYPAKTENASKAARRAGIRMVVIPVRHRVSMERVCNWASEPCIENVMRTHDWENLLNELNRFLVSICPAVKKAEDPTKALEKALLRKWSKVTPGIPEMRWVGCIPEPLSACGIKPPPLNILPPGANMMGTWSLGRFLIYTKSYIKCILICDLTPGCTGAVFTNHPIYELWHIPNCWLYGGSWKGYWTWAAQWGFVTYEIAK